MWQSTPSDELVNANITARVRREHTHGQRYCKETRR